MRRLSLAFFLALAFHVCAFAQLTLTGAGKNVASAGNSLAISCPGTGTVSSSITCTGTYTGTAPATTGWTYAWNTTCTGSGPVTSVASVSLGSITGIVVPTPSGVCAGTVTLTTNIPTSANSGSVTISAPNCGASGPWTCVAHAQSPGSPTGGTTAPIDCSTANLITAAVYLYQPGQFSLGISDSSGNTWTALGGNPSSGYPNFLTIYAAFSPTVSSSQTFTVSGSGTFSSVSIACWHDASGTPSFDGSVTGGGVTGSVTTIAGGSTGFNPSAANGLVISGVSTAFDAVTYTPDSGFTVTDHIAAGAGVSVGGAVAFKIVPVAVTTNTTWTLSPPSTTGAATTLVGIKP